MKNYLGYILTGLAIGGVTIGIVVYVLLRRDDGPGSIEVKSSVMAPESIAYNMLLRDTINRGHGFHKPAAMADWGNPDLDFSRLPTTYYHRRSPVGIVLKRFDWFGDVTADRRSNNIYHSDARLPAALVAMSAPIVGVTLPLANLTEVWSEPALGVIYLNTGTIASYARPFQRIDFYERDDAIADLSWPKGGKEPRFVNVQEALGRGALIRRIAGEERDALAASGPDRFYQVLVIETSRRHSNYPATNLLTREAMQLFMSKLAERGILCYHTSSRLYDLPPMLANTAADLGFASRRGQDSLSDPNRQFFTSEWTMVARKDEYLSHLAEPAGYKAQLAAQAIPAFDAYWSTPAVTNLPRMTDAETGALGSYRRR